MARHKQGQQGFTLIEIILVVAIIGVISATLVPQFAILSARSKMSTDISSVKILQAQINAYYADFASSPGNTTENMISTLVKEDYLNTKYINAPRNEIYLETPDASVLYDPVEMRVRLKVSPQEYNLYKKGVDRDEWMSSN